MLRLVYAMPAKRKVASKLVKKRRTKKPPQASLAVARVGFSSGLNFLPDKFISKLKWNKTYNLGANPTDIAQMLSFRLTSLYDPESAVASSLQPYGFDQLMTNYAHYKVLSAKTKVRFIHKAGNPMIVGCITTPDESKTYIGSSDRDQFINDPQSRYQFLHNDYASCSITNYYSKNRTFGKTNDQNLTANSVSNPAENFFLQTYLCNAGPGDTQASIVMIVEIEYVAEFTERLTIAKS